MSFNNKETFQPIHDDTKKLNQGATGEVTIVRHCDTGTLYIQKRMQKDKIKKKIVALSRIQREIDVLKTLRSDHTTRLYGQFLEDGIPVLITDFSENKSMDSFDTTQFPESSLWDFVTQMAVAFSDLNELRVLHLDVKPANIVSRTTGEYKLIDFGESAILKRGHIYQPTDLVGTPSFQSPESRDCKLTSSKSDLFSFGITLLDQIGIKTTPERIANANPVERGFSKEERMKWISMEYSLLLRSLTAWLCEERPSQRICIQDLLLIPVVFGMAPASYSSFATSRLESKLTYRGDFFLRPQLAQSLLETGHTIDALVIAIQLLRRLRQHKRDSRQCGCQQLPLPNDVKAMITPSFLRAILARLSLEKNRIQQEHTAQFRMKEKEAQDEKAFLDVTEPKHSPIFSHEDGLIIPYASSDNGGTNDSDSEMEDGEQDEMKLAYAEARKHAVTAIFQRRKARQIRHDMIELDAQMALKRQKRRLTRVIAENIVNTIEFEQKRHTKQHNVADGEDLIEPTEFVESDIDEDPNLEFHDILLELLSLIVQLGTHNTLETMLSVGLGALVLNLAGTTYVSTPIAQSLPHFSFASRTSPQPPLHSPSAGGPIRNISGRLDSPQVSRHSSRQPRSPPVLSPPMKLDTFMSPPLSSPNMFKSIARSLSPEPLRPAFGSLTSPSPNLRGPSIPPPPSCPTLADTSLGEYAVFVQFGVPAQAELTRLTRRLFQLVLLFAQQAPDSLVIRLSQQQLFDFSSRNSAPTILLSRLFTEALSTSLNSELCSDICFLMVRAASTDATARQAVVSVYLTDHLFERFSDAMTSFKFGHKLVLISTLSLVLSFQLPHPPHDWEKKKNTLLLHLDRMCDEARAREVTSLMHSEVDLDAMCCSVQTMCENLLQKEDC
ncbi:putative Protein kinase domain containing protein [Blattamonas nauphoetae]|uniref:Protein kinase domain-containing protein n=1 Tax=Blattamonas nauphoetae TaxID=2049346 RepID=A0ABQ9YEB3_9EUKA|nr:putative Protein kinase domain containing protein [Blattamonas nauphoetae]